MIDGLDVNRAKIVDKHGATIAEIVVEKTILFSLTHFIKKMNKNKKYPKAACNKRKNGQGLRISLQIYY